MQTQQRWRWLTGRGTRTNLNHVEDRKARARVPRGRGDQYEGGRQIDHTRSGDRGGKRREHLFVSMRWAGDLGGYIFLDSANSSPLSKSTAGLTPSCRPQFEKPSSAPLIDPVVTITPKPLHYHVRTSYIKRKIFPTTNPSQLT